MDGDVRKYSKYCSGVVVYTRLLESGKVKIERPDFIINLQWRGE